MFLLDAIKISSDNQNNYFVQMGHTAQLPLGILFLVFQAIIRIIKSKPVVLVYNAIEYLMDAIKHNQILVFIVCVLQEAFVNFHLICQNYVLKVFISQNLLLAKMDFNAYKCKEDVTRTKWEPQDLNIVQVALTVL